jgi:hypothetical protein
VIHDEAAWPDTNFGFDDSIKEFEEWFFVKDNLRKVIGRNISGF